MMLTKEQILEIEQEQKQKLLQDREAQTWPDLILKAYMAGFVGGLAYYERHICKFGLQR